MSPNPTDRRRAARRAATAGLAGLAGLSAAVAIPAALADEEQPEVMSALPTVSPLTPEAEALQRFADATPEQRDFIVWMSMSQTERDYVNFMSASEEERNFVVWVSATDEERAAFVGALAPPEPAPRASAPRQSSASVSGGSVWDSLAQCEAGGNWASNTGNGYSGGLQFAASTWRSHGGGEFASSAGQASREQQIVVAERVLASSGWGAWPACSRKLGLR
jgi:hypothetical protein